MNNTCIVSGSFDPITLGHLDIIERSCRLFSKVYVAVMGSESKTGLFSIEERMKMATMATQALPGVEVVTSNGMLIDLAREKSAPVIVRGMRNGGDFSYESQMATLNHLMDGKIETVFLLSRLPHITSSAVREIIHFGGDFSKFVDPKTENEIKTILKKRGK